MYSYIIGKIISINNHSITLESNYCAYIIKVRNPKHFEINKVKKIYLFKTASIIDNQIYEIMYGFESYDEKWVFVSDFNNGYSPEKAFKLAYTNNQTKSLTDETRRSLINLGYTSAEIAYAFNNVKINKKDDLSDCISKCIKVIALS